MNNNTDKGLQGNEKIEEAIEFTIILVKSDL